LIASNTPKLLLGIIICDFFTNCKEVLHGEKTEISKFMQEVIVWLNQGIYQLSFVIELTNDQ
jgi:hypothetical protein